MALKATRSDGVFDLDGLAKLVGVKPWDEYFDPDWMQTPYGESEEQDEEYHAEEKEYFDRYVGAVEQAAERMFSDHGMTLVEKKKRIKGGGIYTVYEVAPKKSWDDAAKHIIETINGVGMFGFDDVKDFIRSGPYGTARSAVLQHLHSMRDYPRVYGDRSYRETFFRSIERG